jgi:hypothetical protein
MNIAQPGNSLRPAKIMLWAFTLDVSATNWPADMEVMLGLAGIRLETMETI